MTWLAAFASEGELKQAAGELRAQEFPVETYTPKPLEEAPSSPVPIVIFIAGMVGLIGGFVAQTYANTWSWPLNAGGRPPISWPSYIVIAFELGILFAVCAGFFGFLIACRMPRLYEKVDECPAFRSASRDGWLLTVGGDPLLSRRALERLRPLLIEEVPQ
ncbi:MAG: DUF3341 domain-containing protein [Acetobacteraceae bacterium]|nr:DUF3341 domain-containing protein [Acetobacteraceae bacterium]